MENYGHDDRPPYGNPSQTFGAYTVGGSQYNAAPFYNRPDRIPVQSQPATNVTVSNPLLHDDDTFTHFACKLLLEINDSKQPGERVLQKVLTAEERRFFSEAYIIQFKALATFACPGEPPRHSLIRRLANAFGDSLLKAPPNDPIENPSLQIPTWTYQPSRPTPDSLQQEPQQHGYNAYQAQQAPQPHLLQRIPTDQSKGSSHPGSKQQKLGYLVASNCQQNDTFELESEHRLIDRDVSLSYRHHSKSDMSPDCKHLKSSPSFRRDRKSKSPKRRTSSSPAQRQPVQRKITPILKKGPDNKHSVQEKVTKVIVQIPRSPKRKDTEYVLEMLPPTTKQSEGKRNQVQTIVAESKTRQILMEEIDRTSALASQSTNPTDQAKYRSHLEGLKIGLESFTAASSVSSLTMIDVGRRNKIRAANKPLSPKEQLFEIDEILSLEKNFLSEQRNSSHEKFFRKSSSDIYNPADIPEEGRRKSSRTEIDEERDDNPTRTLNVDHTVVPHTISCEYNLMKDNPRAFSKNSLEKIETSPSRRSNEASQKPQGADFMFNHLAHSNMQDYHSIQKEQVSRPSFMKVVSPGHLPENFQFAAEVEGRAFTATVPPGGVGPGEVFESTVWRATEYQDKETPHHRWKDGLFDCFRYGFDHPSLLISFFCPHSTFQNHDMQIRIKMQ